MSTSSTTTTVPDVQASLCPEIPVASCRASASQRSVLVLRNGATDAKDLLKWKIVRGGHAAAGDLRDPPGGNVTLALCLYDAGATSQPLLAGVLLPAGTCGGKPCWKAIAGGYRYKNKAATPAGMTDVKLRVSGAGELALVVKGKGAALALPPLSLVPPVRLQLVVSDATGSTCWESHFASPLKNDSTVFRAN
jgi:hypothetical protein